MPTVHHPNLIYFRELFAQNVKRVIGSGQGETIFVSSELPHSKVMSYTRFKQGQLVIFVDWQ